MIKTYLNKVMSLQGVTLHGEYAVVFSGEYVTIVRDGADIYEIMNTELK